MNEPAFPSKGVGFDNHGMSLRDYFAAVAIQGMLANLQDVDRQRLHSLRNGSQPLAVVAYCVADEMLKERAKTIS